MGTLSRISLILAICCFIACSDDDSSTEFVNEPTSVDDDPVVPNDQGPTPVSSRIPCENGFADVYPCNGYDLVGMLSLEDLGATLGSDIWGWTDPQTKREYALVGMFNGTVFVDVTDDELVIMGRLPTQSGSDFWRDIKVFGNYAFIVADIADHGMQVFDLTRLRDLEDIPVKFKADAVYSAFGNAHNIVINERKSMAYVVGTNINDAYNGGVHFIDISDPMNPTEVGGYGGSGYTHDAQVVTYNGPDTDYLGEEIFVGSNEDRVVIVNVTDKDNPQLISELVYPQTAYTHQGWFTEDQQYFILGDEVDELAFGFNSRTLVFDFEDLDNPQLHMTYLGPTVAIDHNGYVKGDEFYLANYTAGMRVLDLSDIDNGNMVETGYFDTYVANDITDFYGVWSVYPYFDSGKVLINDSDIGFFVVQKSN